MNETEFVEVPGTVTMLHPLVKLVLLVALIDVTTYGLETNTGIPLSMKLVLAAFLVGVPPVRFLAKKSRQQVTVLTPPVSPSAKVPLLSSIRLLLPDYTNGRMAR